MRPLAQPARVAALAAALVASSCTPTLTDGRYSCPDGLCPTGWTCDVDRSCRQTPAADGGTDAAAADAPVGILSPCTEEADCGGLRCYRGRSGWPTGFCTPMCTGDPDCRTVPAEGAACDDSGPNVCILLCDDTSGTCPPELKCVGIYRDEMDPIFTLGECIPSTAPLARSSQRACTMGFDCGVEEMCAEMRCARPCSIAAGLPCATGETCTASPVGDVCR